MGNRSLIELHTAVLLFGLSGLFGKLISLSPPVIVFGRALFASLFLFLLLRFINQSIKLERKKHYLYFIMLGIVLALHWSTFFLSIRMSTVAIGLMTFSTFPIFVTFIEPFFFKDRIRVSAVLTAIVTLLGVALVIPKFELAGSMTQGALWGIVSGLAFAILSVMNKKYVSEYKSLVISFYQNSIAAIVLLPFLFAAMPAFEARNILLLVLLGVVFTGISHSLFIKGMSGVKAQTASIIACLEPVYGIAATALIIGEIPAVKTILGGIVILAAVSYSTIKSGKAV